MCSAGSLLELWLLVVFPRSTSWCRRLRWRAGLVVHANRSWSGHSLACCLPLGSISVAIQPPQMMPPVWVDVAVAKKGPPPLQPMKAAAAAYWDLQLPTHEEGARLVVATLLESESILKCGGRDEAAVLAGCVAVDEVHGSGGGTRWEDSDQVYLVCSAEPSRKSIGVWSRRTLSGFRSVGGFHVWMQPQNRLFYSWI